MLNLGELRATGTTLQATAGQHFLAVPASFTDPGPDPGPASAYTAVIDWGDRSRPSSGGVSILGPGRYEVPASHTYTDPGSYTITVTITDTHTQGRTAVAFSTAEVSDPGHAPRGSGGSGNGKTFAGVAGLLASGGLASASSWSEAKPMDVTASPAVPGPLSSKGDSATLICGDIPSSLAHPPSPLDRADSFDSLSVALFDQRGTSMPVLPS
jgi:PKD repeat protein